LTTPLASPSPSTRGGEVTVSDVVSYRVTTRKPGYLAIFDATGRPAHTGFPQYALDAFADRGRAGSCPPVAGSAAADPKPRNPYEGFAIRILEPRGKVTLSPC